MVIQHTDVKAVNSVFLFSQTIIQSEFKRTFCRIGEGQAQITLRITAVIYVSRLDNLQAHALCYLTVEALIRLQTGSPVRVKTFQFWRKVDFTH